MDSAFTRLVDEIYTWKLIPCKGGGQKALDVFIPREEAQALYEIVVDLRPHRTLEVGMANGLSTLHIAAALESNCHGMHTAIDPFQTTEWNDSALHLLELANLSHRVNWIERLSHQALPELERSGVRFEFAFIDGAHLTDFVFCDFLCVDRVLEVGGLIAFDDSDWPAIKQVIRYVLANRRYVVAYSGLVIERPYVRPAIWSRLLRMLASRFPKVMSKLRTDFLLPDEALGILGRLVVLKKLGDDDRDSQRRESHKLY